jgi:PAS domain S-box-containing protein
VVARDPHDFEAASRLAAIVESSADAMIGKTLDGVVTSWNAGAERMYGYGAKEIVGRNISVLIPPDRVDELSAILLRVAGGERVEQYETQRLRKNGVVFDASVTISPIRDRAGVIVGASTVARDITDRKRAEADVLDLRDQLHQAQRLESIGQLAGGIAHDFNNLLAGIMNYAALASDGLAGLRDRLGLSADEALTTVTEDVMAIANVATRAARLTRQLLVFSRRELVTPEVLDLNAIVVDMESLLRRTIGETIDLVTVLEDDLPQTTGDRGQIEQVLMNLAVNARDAMVDGGSLRIETACYEAGDDERRYGLGRGRYVCLSVADTGQGMAPDVVARAFEPFFSTKAKGEGTGLGLATVYGIVTQAGGNVILDSESGVGTRIRVYLPATSTAATVVPATPPGVRPASGGETVLLVEDEEMVREPTRRILARSGYAVLAADSADEALRIVADHFGEIELLLTDVVMPGRSGKALAAAVKRVSPATKVLYMSGYTSDVIAFRELSEEGVDLIEKPFASEDLLRKVRDILDTEQRR